MGDYTERLRNAIRQSRDSQRTVECEWAGDYASLIAAAEQVSGSDNVDYHGDHTNGNLTADLFGWDDDAPSDEHMDWRVSVTLV